MTTSAITRLSDTMPDVRPFQTIPWNKGYGTDYYGALHVAADYCGLTAVPELHPGVWQHGAVPPWQQVQPEMCIYCAPRNLPVWVARQDEVVYLREAGYTRVRAIGLPILYTQPQEMTREPGSLLVMPMHAIPNDPNSTDSDVYIEQLLQFKSRFSTVVACVSGRCMDGGLWTQHFESAGIEVVRGSTVNDATSLSRMRRLFETFEYVTTNAYGSHIPYALYFGAKVSIWGWCEPITSEYLLRDALWAMFPAAADRFLADETLRKRELILGCFRVPPHLGIGNVELGSHLIGADNKLTPDELRAAFRWTTPHRIGACLRGAAWNCLPWRVQQLIRRAQQGQGH